jgi:hypothetical protein
LSQKSCSACRHAARAEIDLALVGGEATRSIAKRINAKAPNAKPLSHDAILRHKKHVGQAISRALARRGEDPPADALAEQFKSNAADEVRLEESLFAKIWRLEKDAMRIGARAESEGDLRAALVANAGLRDVVKLLHEMTPAPKVTDATLRAEAEKMAAALGDTTADEILSLAAQLADGDYSGLGSKDFDLTRTISAAAKIARLPDVPAAPLPVLSAPSTAIISGVPPPLPSVDDAGEVPPGLVLGRRPWAIVV